AHRQLMLATGASARLTRQATIDRLLAALDGAVPRREPTARNGTSRDARELGIASLLTPRERTILELLACGTGNETIADALGISLYTVRTHVQSVIGKLGAHSRIEAVAVARRDGVFGRSDVTRTRAA